MLIHIMWKIMTFSSNVLANDRLDINKGHLPHKMFWKRWAKVDTILLTSGSDPLAGLSSPRRCRRPSGPSRRRAWATWTSSCPAGLAAPPARGGRQIATRTSQKLKRNMCKSRTLKNENYWKIDLRVDLYIKICEILKKPINISHSSCTSCWNNWNYRKTNANTFFKVSTVDVPSLGDLQTFHSKICEIYFTNVAQELLKFHLLGFAETCENAWK